MDVQQSSLPPGTNSYYCPSPGNSSFPELGDSWLSHRAKLAQSSTSLCHAASKHSQQVEYTEVASGQKGITFHSHRIPRWKKEIRPTLSAGRRGKIEIEWLLENFIERPRRYPRQQETRNSSDQQNLTLNLQGAGGIRGK